MPEAQELLRVILPEPLMAAIDEHAAATRRQRSDVVREILVEGLEAVADDDAPRYRGAREAWAVLLIRTGGSALPTDGGATNR
jgi:metal-responsive CopG/Arc/MetJ family transcriptional regulator